MIPLLIITANPEKSIHKECGLDPSQLSPDLIYFTSTTSIGINDIKKALTLTHTKPLSLPLKYLIFPKADTITPVAQNALLKSLEESPVYLQYILCTPQLETLLDTIISRCRIIYHQNPSQTSNNPELAPLIINLKTATISQKIALAQTYSKTRDQALILIHDLITHYRHRLHQNPQFLYAEVLKKLASCHTALKANTHPTLTLEHLLLTTTWIV